MTTPMMQQYQEAKQRHPGMVLLFRMGDFFELFFDDADVGARDLGLTLTSRDGSVKMAGFPCKVLELHLRKLLQAGHRVAICDQVEDAAVAKGIVKREVTRVITPGTLTEEDLLDPKTSNHLAAIAPVSPRGPIGLAWLELSTGTFYATDVPRDRLADELARLAPSECLCAEGAAESWLELARLRDTLGNLTSTRRPDWNFDPQSARAALYSHFQVTTLAGFGFDDNQPCLTAGGALVLYLNETLKAGLSHLRRVRPFVRERYLFLDEVTRRSLELTRTLREGAHSGSLLAAIDRTVTPMGARLLNEWVLAPLADRSAIEQRLDSVAEMLDSHARRQAIRGLLQKVFDLQRLTARVSTGRASPRDLRGVGQTLAMLPFLKEALAGLTSPLLLQLDRSLETCPQLRSTLESALVDEPPLSPREGGVIRRGFDHELDELHEIASSGKEWIARFQAEEITRTGIPSLKVGFNQVFGYYIEITHAQAARVPADYHRKQTLKNAERYITPELKAYEEKVLSAEDKIHTREYELFLALRDKVADEMGRLLTAAEVMATLDVLASQAELAVERNYCRPELCDEPILEIRDGRHPVLDQSLPPGTFVPNDLVMGPGDGIFLLITGPNMGGKSVYLRQAGLLTLLAQMGGFVPARRARIGLADRIFTRVGASDELGRGQSTFMVEMTEAANILNNATAHSLVLLDEIGRGTSTYDGVSLAWAMTEHLHNVIGSRTLFATHYHELAQLAERLPGLRNYNALVHEAPEEIVFLHKIAPGSADKSYGIHVAHRAGVPAEVLDRARAVLAQLEAHPVQTPDDTIRKPRKMEVASLFANMEDPVMQELRELRLDRVDAKELASLVRRWQRELGR